MNTELIPIVIGALGAIIKGMSDNIRKISERNTKQEIQNICLLVSVRIDRKVLS